MRLGSSIRRRRGLGDDEPRRGSGERASTRSRAPDRLLLVTLGTVVVGFGGGWWVATRVLFPPPPPPGDLYDVPDVYGVDLQEAARQIEAAGLTVGTVDPLRHPIADSGRVVGQDPLPGQLAPPDAPVRVSVSLGVERRPVPDVAQLRGDRARVVLEAAGFIVLLDSVPSDEPRGRVVVLEPEAGTQLPVPGEVRVGVSLGPPQVSMPSLLGLDEADARESIEALGLVVTQVDEVAREGSDEGRVVEQDPPPDRLVERGSAVRIVVGRPGLRRDTVPGGG